MPRQQKLIKWDEVIQRMESGNSAQTIANAFDITATCLYDRFFQEFGVPFADKRREFNESGKQNIEYLQYKRAMQGNDRMLIWLGQVKCGQVPSMPNVKPSNENYVIQPGTNDPGVAIGISAERLSKEHNQGAE